MANPKVKTIAATYDEIRKYLQPGCAVFFESGEGFYAWLILTFTKSPGHAGLLDVDEAGNVVLYEALNHGVDKVFLSQRIRDAKGRVWIAPLEDWAQQRVDRSKLSTELQRCYRAGYAWVAAVLSGVGQLIGIPGKSIGKRKFCSQLVQNSLVAAGLDLGYDQTPTPHELSQYDCWKAFFQVKGDWKEL